MFDGLSLRRRPGFCSCGLLFAADEAGGSVNLNSNLNIMQKLNWSRPAGVLQNLVPLVVSGLSWIGIALALTVMVGLMLALLVMMSPLWSLYFAFSGLAKWWGEQFDKGTLLVFPHN